MEGLLDIQDIIGEPLVSSPQGFRFTHIFQSKEGLSYLLRPASQTVHGAVMRATASSRRGPWDTVEWKGGSLRHGLGGPISPPRLSLLGSILKTLLTPRNLPRKRIYRDARGELLGVVDFDAEIAWYVLTLATGPSYRFGFWCEAWPRENCVLPLATPVSARAGAGDERLITWPCNSGLPQTKGIVVRRRVEETPILLAAVWLDILNDSDGG